MNRQEIAPMVRALERAGFSCESGNGGHELWSHHDGRRIAIPDPARTHITLRAGRLRSQLRRLGVKL